MNEATQDLIDLLARRDDPEAVRALLAAGADPNDRVADDTALLTGVEYDRVRSVQAMLSAGADACQIIETEWTAPSPWAIIKTRPFHPISYLLAPLIWLSTRGVPAPDGPLIKRLEQSCHSPDMARLLVRYGADPTKFDEGCRPAAMGADKIARQTISAQMFTQTSAPRPGRENPERCDTPFCIEQIRTGRSGWVAQHEIMGDAATREIGDEPVWSFQRFGQSATRLTDGRLVLIAGEHEDFYDPDFHIYNDVVVLDGQGGVELYLYPKLYFPPTDFHTATLDGNVIWIVGSLGYRDRRDPSRTQVLRLDLTDMSVAPVQTTGEVPPWLSHHSAEMHGREIFCGGGKVEPDHQDNPHRYALNVDTGKWRRLT